MRETIVVCSLVPIQRRRVGIRLAGDGTDGLEGIDQVRALPLLTYITRSKDNCCCVSEWPLFLCSLFFSSLRFRTDGKLRQT